MEYELYGGMAPHQNTDTSFAAAVAMTPKAQTLRKQVHECIIALSGATDEQVQKTLKMPGNTERPRRRELELLGMVKDSGLRRPTDSGKQAIVWEAV